jgi:hypothetical protein
LGRPFDLDRHGFDLLVMNNFHGRPFSCRLARQIHEVHIRWVKH